MPLHVMIAADGGEREAFAFDKDERWLEEYVVSPRRQGRAAFIGGQMFAWPDVSELRIAETQLKSSQLLPKIRARRMRAPVTVDRADGWHLLDEGVDVTERFLAGPPGFSEVATTRGPAETDHVVVMVVHGQDHEANVALFDWLRAIGLAPREWSDLVRRTGSASPFIGDVLASAFAHARAVVVYFTPDEHVALRPGLAADEAVWRLQARPNVLFEAGMALATHPDRTVLAVLGSQELPSDLAGRHYVRLDGRVETLHDFANRLEAAGCAVRRTGGQWLDPSRFPKRDSVMVAPDGQPDQRTHKRAGGHTG